MSFPILEIGAVGPHVLEVQNRLRARGFNAGALDGKFGEGTKAAVTAFQRSEGLLADGIVGARTAGALGIAEPPAVDSVLELVTPDLVCRMFPATQRTNIETNLPVVLDALIAPELTDKRMVLMALGTIRAETECFQPVSETVSRFNTSPGGHPFDLYDYRRDLGNNRAGDGAKYRGRGFVQLTGRHNYAVYGGAIGLGDKLVKSPDLANEPVIAARLLAGFLKIREIAIKEALLENDLSRARRLVNGGTAGLDRFTEAYRRGDELLGS
jgi:peptidoglycan L-alanyl-D-glutamate endopeptidase CwlK